MDTLLSAVVLLSAAIASIAVVVVALRHAAGRSTLPSATIIVTQSPGNQSPRAVAHATAAITAGLTDAVLFVCEPPAPPSHPRLTFIPIHPAPASTGRRTPVALLRKLVHFGTSLYAALRAAAAQPVVARYLILNTPPVLPTLGLVAAVRPFLFPSARLTVDVHNLAFSLMRLTSPRPVVLLATALEALSLRAATNVCTVSAALANYLRTQFHVSAAVVRDRPAREFCTAREKPPSREALHTLLRRYATIVAPANHPLTVDISATSPEGENAAASRAPPVIVAPTSWTPDEDFEPLRAALAALDAQDHAVTAVLTGNGPLRAGWEARMRDANFRNVAVVFAFLPRADYAALLAGADAGVCMHASSSGLDLPMKAVDMCGAALPVVARRYACIDELVVHGRSGFLWNGGAELARILQHLLFSEGGRGELEAVRRWLDKDALARETESASSGQWQLEWERKALPLLSASRGVGKRS